MGCSARTRRSRIHGVLAGRKVAAFGVGVRQSRRHIRRARIFDWFCRQGLQQRLVLSRHWLGLRGPEHPGRPVRRPASAPSQGLPHPRRRNRPEIRSEVPCPRRDHLGRPMCRFCRRNGQGRRRCPHEHLRLAPLVQRDNRRRRNRPVHNLRRTAGQRNNRRLSILRLRNTAARDPAMDTVVPFQRRPRSLRRGGLNRHQCRPRINLLHRNNRAARRVSPRRDAHTALRKPRPRLENNTNSPEWIRIGGIL